MIDFGLEVELMLVNTVHSTKKFGQVNTKVRLQDIIQKHIFNLGQAFMITSGLVHIEHIDKKQVNLLQTILKHMKVTGQAHG